MSLVGTRPPTVDEWEQYELHHRSRAPHFIETGHLEPAPVSDEMLEKVKSVVSHALNSLEIKNGASHSEIKIDEKGIIRIIEIGARMGGDCIGILLIDEYDVPLDKAFQYGYYDEMVSLLRNMFGNALKTNPNLYFAVLTGCLRISKESIFTGLNNLKVLTLTDVRFDEYFGFTDTEVKGMLEYYGLSGHYAEVKEWYDGYRFGNVEVYCPWDVINYCDLLRADPNALPQDYWSNTSGNAMVRRFIDKADTQTRDEIERLIAGDEILKEIHQELTYNELDSSIEEMLG